MIRVPYNPLLRNKKSFVRKSIIRTHLSLTLTFIILVSLSYWGQGNPAEAQTTSCTKASIPMTGIRANGDDGNVPQNTNDNNFNTRWSNNGLPSWIQFDLGSTRTLCYVDIAWYQGDSRQYRFGMHVSTVWPNLQPLASATSSGNTASFERYDVPDTDARIFRISVYGNTAANIAAISEVAIYTRSEAQSTACTKTSIPMSNIRANSHDGNIPQNTNDNNFNTRWSNNGLPSWIQFDLGSTRTLCYVDIAWYQGDSRQYRFGMHVSTVWPNFHPLAGATSSGTTASFERHDVPDATTKVVRISVYSNTAANNAAISEVAVYTRPPPSIVDTNLQVQTVAVALNSPTSMAFIGPDDILVLEKNTGLVKRIKDGTILSPPLLDLNVASNSERGLLGIDVVRRTSSQHYVFLYYTKSDSTDGGTAVANQLVRYVFTNDPNVGPAQGTMTSPELLLDLPVTPGPNHDGGKVVIGPDSNVYTVLGDLNRQGQAQNFENGPAADGTGGILRITQDGFTVGSGIIGNTNPLNKYFAYGIRNSFGIDFDPLSGKLWESENGPASNDELNLVEPGFNSGWRDLMGPAPAGFDFSNLVSFDGKGVYSDPEFTWTTVVAPTAIEFFNSGKLGSQYQNDMFVADANNGRIYDFNMNSQRNGFLLSGALSDKIANTDAETQSLIFGGGFGLITDLKIGPEDGHLYVLSFAGNLHKIVPN
jgi:glucose/arabinose dehydrogenase